MKYEIRTASVDSIIVYFGDEISNKTSQNIQKIIHTLNKEKNSSIIEIIPSYTTLLITYDILNFDSNKIEKYIKKIIEKSEVVNYEKDYQIIEIPTYYGKEVGFDLEEISKNKNLSIEEIIKIHSNKIYRVYTIGFAPGFAYLAKVDERINIPRLKTPRKKVPKGSVAIAESQTSIYPSDSPGGWNIIGKTYLDVFNKSRENITTFEVGDLIKFIPVSKEIFLKNGGIL